MPLRLVPLAKSVRQLDYIIAGLSFVRWIGHDHPAERGAVKNMRPSFAASNLADRRMRSIGLAETSVRPVGIAF